MKAKKSTKTLKISVDSKEEKEVVERLTKKVVEAIKKEESFKAEPLKTAYDDAIKKVEVIRSCNTALRWKGYDNTSLISENYMNWAMYNTYL